MGELVGCNEGNVVLKVLPPQTQHASCIDFPKFAVFSSFKMAAHQSSGPSDIWLQMKPANLEVPPTNHPSSSTHSDGLELGNSDGY